MNMFTINTLKEVVDVLLNVFTTLITTLFQSWINTFHKIVYSFQVNSFQNGLIYTFSFVVITILIYKVLIRPSLKLATMIMHRI